MLGPEGHGGANAVEMLVDFLDVVGFLGEGDGGQGGAQANLGVGVVQGFADDHGGLEGEAVEFGAGEFGGLPAEALEFVAELLVSQPALQGSESDLGVTWE